MTIHQSEEGANVTQMNAKNIPIILFEYSTECYNKKYSFLQGYSFNTLLPSNFSVSFWCKTNVLTSKTSSTVNKFRKNWWELLWNKSKISRLIAEPLPSHFVPSMTDGPNLLKEAWILQMLQWNAERKKITIKKRSKGLLRYDIEGRSKAHFGGWNFRSQKLRHLRRKI